jgi:bifunctional non-homologous end joining protein LigD
MVGTSVNLCHEGLCRIRSQSGIHPAHVAPAHRAASRAPLSARRELVLPHLSDPIRAVREQGLEWLVAKRLDSVYEASQRSGAWRKMRVDRSQESVTGGYTVSGRHFDALIFGYWEGDRLMYAARTRSGFTPALREQLHQRLRGLEVSECPFANLPEARVGR